MTYRKARDIVLENSIEFDNIKNISSTRNESDHTNFWNKICLIFYNRIKYNNALKLYYWFKRNKHDYSTLLEQYLKENSSKIFDQLSSKISIIIESSKWQSFQQYITVNQTGRKSLSSSFTDFLSDELQKRDINCYLKCKFNWFKKKDSKKKSSPFWYGQYYCMECNNEIIVSIISDMFICMNIFIKEKDSHEKKVSKKIRCIGKQRDIQLNDIRLNGSLNCQTENVLANQLISNKNGKSFIFISY